MEDIQAFPIAFVEASTLVEEAQVVVFRCKQEDDSPFNIAVPYDQLANLMLVASQASSAIRKSGSSDPKKKITYPVEWWEAGVAEEDPNVVLLSIRLDGGSEMTYHFHRNAIALMREVFGNILGQGTSAPPDTSKH